MNRVKAYFVASYEELVNKTSWPTWKELQRSSVLVAVASIIIALLIFLMDKAIVAVLNAFYDLF